MNRRSFVSLLTAALASAQEPTQQVAPAPAAAGPPGTYTISGTVVNAATNAPLPKVLVQIALPDNRSQTREVVTGADGRFSFSNLAQQKFSLSVTRQSGPAQGYLGRGAYSSAIVTGPDLDTSNIVFPFHMPGTITGTVVDENSEAVRNAQLYLFAHRIDARGLWRISMAGSNSTRSNGQFRFAHLAPGRYLLAVSAKPWFAGKMYPGFVYSGPMAQLDARASGRAPSPPPDPQFDVAYPFTYYANAVDPASASPITVSEGSEAAVQITLRPVPSIHVKLVAANARPGSMSHVQVSVLGPGNNPIFINAPAFVQNGQGELTGIAPGRYQLSTNAFAFPSQGLDSMPNAEQPRVEINRAEVTRKIVDLVDGTTVDLTSASHISVKATVTTSGSDHPSNRIGLLLSEVNTGLATNAMAKPDGTLSFPETSLTAGRYALSLSNTPAFRILSVESKGAKLAEGEIIIGENADVQLSVLIGRLSTVRLEGFAVREDRRVVAAMVLLVPKVQIVGVTVYQDQSDSDGSFVFRNVSAGDYLALAIDDGRDFAFGDPAVLKPYLAGAISLRITEGGKQNSITIPVQQRTAQSG